MQATNTYYPVSLRLQKLTSAKTTNVQSLAYSYDSVGNFTNITDEVYTGAPRPRWENPV